MNAKTIGQSALGTLQTCAYALPTKGSLEHLGGRLAAGLAVVQFALGFLPDEVPPDPPSPLTAEQMRAELDEVKKEIITALWDSDLDDKQSGVLAIDTQNTAVWASVHRLSYDTVESVMVQEPLHNLIKSLEEYFNTAAQDALWVRLEAFRLKVEGGGIDVPAIQAIGMTQRAPTASLYLLIGSLLVTYLKYAVTWQWVRVLTTNIRIDSFNSALLVWNGLTQAQKDVQSRQNAYNDPNVKYKDVINTQQISWATYSQAGPVQLVKDEVKALLHYSLGAPAANGAPSQTGFYSFLSANQGCLGFDPAQDGGPIWEGNPNLDELLENKYLVSEYGEHIAAWRAAVASVSYQEHIVVSGDTLIGLATKYYNDASRASDLLATNGDILSDPNVLAVGQVLRIYDQDALADAPRPKAPAVGGGN